MSKFIKSGKKIIFKKQHIPAKVSKTVKKYVKKEIKLLEVQKRNYQDTVIDSFITYIDYAGEYTCLSVIAQGVTDDDRLGDNCNLLKLDYDFTVYDAYNNTYSNFQILIVQYHPNAAVTGSVYATTFLEAAYLSTTDAPYSPLREALKSEFTVLKRWRWTNRGYYPPGGSIATSDIKGKRFTGSIKNLRKKMQFIPGATTATNHIFIVCVSDDASASSTKPFIDGVTRLWFTNI